MAAHVISSLSITTYLPSYDTSIFSTVLTIFTLVKVVVNRPSCELKVEVQRNRNHILLCKVFYCSLKRENSISLTKVCTYVS